MTLTINGRFFENEGKPFFVKAVTYGPFPPDKKPDPASEFPRISAAGFNAIRVYEAPSGKELDLAEENNLFIFPTIPWFSDSLFTENQATIEDAHRELSLFLTRNGNHPALGLILIANEIRPDLVRFMGPANVREVLEDLINDCRELAPNISYGYANFPTTEYLEPRNADFTAFNVYLEEQSKFESYLQRLHNIAGDRPLLLTEFGYNTWSHRALGLSNPNLERQQSEMLTWAYQSAREQATAGFTVYSWCDLWFNGGREVEDWSFGLTRRDGTDKPALAALSELLLEHPQEQEIPPLFTVAICTRNGSQRLKKNLPYFEKIEDPNFELLIVDDGSRDNTKKIAKAFCKKSPLNCRYLPQAPGGLSAARNRAARDGEGTFIVYIDDDARPQPQWLYYLREAFGNNSRAAAAGGPNLPPKPSSLQNALVTACPGNASHILFTDDTAEHLPGCNFALRRKQLLEIGGFDKRFHAAGDDVDVCWRLLDAGHELAFHPAACVVHDRRPTVSSFLRQQRGYGEAEALLYQKHPQRFGSDGIRWQGFIYSGATLSADAGAVIYHGPMGEAPFQMLSLRHMPIRPLSLDYDSKLNRALLRIIQKLASHQRRKTRKEHGGPTAAAQKPPSEPKAHQKEARKDYPLAEADPRARVLASLLSQNWKVSLHEEIADLQRGPVQLIFAQTQLPNSESILHLRIISPPIDLSEIFAELDEVIHP